jgi:hypothetical protein
MYVMALNAASHLVERTLGHNTDHTSATTGIGNPARDNAAHPSGEKMKALAWMGKNDVRISNFSKT